MDATVTTSDRIISYGNNSRADNEKSGNPYRRYPEREDYEAWTDHQRADGSTYRKIHTVSRWGGEYSNGPERIVELTPATDQAVMS